ncbi:nitrate- and nitrite sensing domain-containing protein [Nonomuraea sp. bgisy101]|uniref:sensor histidine kinase n=1 Tax=Nonomuraea sp. bgisy101 TaxID=3413784 RepID=UPI003D755C56
MRTKVAALLVSLTALWAFAAWTTIREGVDLLRATTLDGGVAVPGGSLVTELQRERRLSLIRLGSGGPADPRALRDQRARTDAAASAFIEQAGASSVALAASDTLDLRLERVFARLEGLRQSRAALDAGALDRERAAAAYTGVIDTIYQAYDSLAFLDDERTATGARALLEMSRAVELISQEDALVTGALAAGGLSVAERGRFAQLVGAQRFARAGAAVELTDADRRDYDDLVAGPAYSRLHDLEDRLTQGAAPAGAEQWRAAVEPVLGALDATVRKAAAGLIERAAPVAVGIIVSLVLVGGLGLIAVVASIVLSVTTTRTALTQLKKLREAAHELSERRLPRVVERIGRGEEVDLAVDAPPLTFGDDEIGEVGRAFNSVQETAIRVAVEQAELRRSIRDILLSLARRTQGLVQRQLTVLDVMERREQEPEELRDLFRLDHLATRMRRNAENLIVLSGSSPGRTWRRSVPMLDVVRGALAEVEDYTRVQLRPLGEATLAGRAVGDVVHLLAELIENAVSFSPPYAMVQVSGQMGVNGYVVEIEDRGLGMTPEDLEAANRRIAEPQEFSGTARLGLYVVAKLAERHGIRVRLRPSQYGGTTVVALVPLELIGLEPEPDDLRLADDTRFPTLADLTRAELGEGQVGEGQVEEGRQARGTGLALGIPAPRSALNGPPGGTATVLRAAPVTGQPVERGSRPPLPARPARNAPEDVPGDVPATPAPADVSAMNAPADMMVTHRPADMLGRNAARPEPPEDGPSPVVSPLDTTVLASGVTGAARAHPDGQPLSAESLTPESLTPESLTPESLTPESLTPESLTPESLTPESLTPESLIALPLAAAPPVAGPFSAESFSAASLISEPLTAEAILTQEAYLAQAQEALLSPEPITGQDRLTQKTQAVREDPAALVSPVAPEGPAVSGGRAALVGPVALEGPAAQEVRVAEEGSAAQEVRAVEEGSAAQEVRAVEEGSAARESRTAHESMTAQEIGGEQERPACTPSGLPFRVPQTHLAPELMTEEATTPHEQEHDERSPEEIRAIMGSFQSGTRLGRTQAAKLTEGEA